MYTINIAQNGMIVGVSFIGKEIKHYKRKTSQFSQAFTIPTTEQNARLLIEKFNLV